MIEQVTDYAHNASQQTAIAEISNGIDILRWAHKGDRPTAFAPVEHRGAHPTGVAPDTASLVASSLRVGFVLLQLL